MSNQPTLEDFWLDVDVPNDEGEYCKECGKLWSHHTLGEIRRCCFL